MDKGMVFLSGVCIAQYAFGRGHGRCAVSGPFNTVYLVAVFRFSSLTVSNYFTCFESSNNRISL